MKILVVGGAGYIGSHMVKVLVESEHNVVVLDNLSNGHRDAVHQDADFILGDLAEKTRLIEILGDGFDGVMHFASFIQVGESVNNPGKYYHNNLCNTLNLLNAMVQTNCKNIVFSSTAAIFGDPEVIPVDESHPTQPINPYGHSKLMAEQILSDYDSAHNIKSVSLRYFNAAGAEPGGNIGERHNPETHLIPLVLQVASGKRNHIEIFGDDYNTTDGTCIRDYIHVMDLCSAHQLALNQLIENNKSSSYNLGNGNGFSVQDVITTAEKITGKKITTIVSPRRAGDPAQLIANSRRAVNELGWKPRHNKLEQIVYDAWQWEKKRTSS